MTKKKQAHVLALLKAAGELVSEVNFIIAKNRSTEMPIELGRASDAIRDVRGLVEEKLASIKIKTPPR